MKSLPGLKNPLDKVKEHELIQRYREGDEEALEDLVLANMRFVVQVASEFQGSVSLEDLVGEGAIALMEAIRDFDLKRDVKLITFAQFRIRAAMHNAIAGARERIDPAALAKFQRELILANNFGSYTLWLRTIAAVRTLNDKDSTFLIKRFGLENYDPHSLSDLAFEFQMSVEGTRQWEKRLLKKLYTILGGEEK
jgi:RNA polymerase sigma factor (sigma-70 family)